MEPWNNELWKKRDKMLEEQNEDQINKKRFLIPMKSKQPLSKERKELASLAKKMAEGEIKWSNDVVLDSKWDALMTREGLAVART